MLLRRSSSVPVAGSHDVASRIIFTIGGMVGKNAARAAEIIRHAKDKQKIKSSSATMFWSMIKCRSRCELGLKIQAKRSRSSGRRVVLLRLA